MKILDRGSSAKRFCLSFLIPILALVMMLLLTTTTDGFAVTTSFTADQDAMTMESSPDTNLGWSDDLMVGRDNDGTKFRSFIKFSDSDLNSIPAHATIQTAELILYRKMHFGTVDMWVWIAYPDWSEDTITWSNQPTGVGQDTSLTPTAGSNNTIRIDVTRHVRDWLDGTWDNAGFFLAHSSTPAPGSYVDFASKESSTSSQCPKLEVTYDDNYEENDTIGTAFNLSSYEDTWLSSINGLGIQADPDWYKIYVSPGYEHVLVDCRFTDSDGDIDIALYDSSETLLDDSETTSNDEYIDYTVPESGYYYIKVYYGDAGNTYNLWWDDEVESQGALKVDLNPYGAINNGARWKVGSDGSWNESQDTVPLSYGTYTLYFKDTHDYKTPSSRSVTIDSPYTKLISQTYDLASINVRIPTASCRWKLGEQDVLINWLLDGYRVSYGYDIRLFKGSWCVKDVVIGLPTTAAGYVWDVPIDLYPGTDYRIEVASPANGSIFAKSAYFEIYSDHQNPDIELNATSHDFGDVEYWHASTPWTFTIYNRGNTDLIIEGPCFDELGGTQFAVSPFYVPDLVISPDDSFSFEFKYQPTEYGHHEVDIDISSNDPDEPMLTLTLSGKCEIICSYSISPTSQPFSSSGGTGSVNVTASSSECGWSATSNNSWITITSGSSGNGNGTVSYSVSSNSSTGSRTGTMTIAGEIFTVMQDLVEPVYRFWSDKFGAHFFTINEDEKNNLDNNVPDDVWRYEKIAWYAYPEGSQPSGAKPVYRFWSDRFGAHFFTINEDEKNNLDNNVPDNVWRYEKIAWYAYSTDYITAHCSQHVGGYQQIGREESNQGYGEGGDVLAGTTGWMETSSLDAPIDFPGPAFVEDGYIYCPGRWGDARGTFHYAEINYDGTLGTWQTTSMPNDHHTQYSATSYDGVIYLVGGHTPDGWLSDVYYAIPDSDGFIFTWISTTSLPRAKGGSRLFAYNGYLYSTGGTNSFSGGENALTEVLYALINPDGSIGNWQSTTSLPAGRCYHGATSHDGYAYIVGGQYAGPSKVATDVLYASIYSDGTIGIWLKTSSLPISEGANLIGCRIFVSGDYFYLCKTKGANYRAFINYNGTIGEWEEWEFIPLFEPDDYIGTYAFDPDTNHIYGLGGGVYNGSIASDRVYYIALEP